MKTKSVVLAAALSVLPASALWAAAGFSKQVYDQPGWARYGVSTYPLNLSTAPTGSGVQNPNLVYSPAGAWNNAGGYAWLTSTDTDSAAAATAMATGWKTYNNAINWSDFNAAIVPTIVRIAHDDGKAAGTITTVQWSHATPAALGDAHNVSRNNYAAIANEMLSSGVLDLMMGAGNPDFDDNGNPASRDPKYVGGAATWQSLKNGTHPGGWQLKQSKADFEALTTGNPTGRILGTAQVYSTLQQARSPNGQGGGFGNPSGDAFNGGVPSLRTMTLGALNVLDNDPDGFFLHIESGAVDWANHANQPDRMIEEQMSFNRSVEAVMDWVDQHDPDMNETLVIVTADHETGLIWGPDSADAPFDPIVDRGMGVVPGMIYNSGGHSNSLVPIYVRGAGGELIPSLVDGGDPTAAAEWLYRWGWDGDYIDNTDVFTLLASSPAKNLILMVSDGAGFNTFDASSMYEGRWVPEPATLALLGIGFLSRKPRQSICPPRKNSNKTRGPTC